MLPNCCKGQWQCSPVFCVLGTHLALLCFFVLVLSAIVVSCLRLKGTTQAHYSHVAGPAALARSRRSGENLARKT